MGTPHLLFRQAENHRGKGHGLELLLTTEEETLKNGVSILGLSVFGNMRVCLDKSFELW